MILEIIIGILGLMVVILGYTTFNLLRKNEKAEDIILTYSDYIQNLSSQINTSEEHLNKIDEKGVFQSDDEIGWFFDQIKSIQKSLSQFKIDQ